MTGSTALENTALPKTKSRLIGATNMSMKEVNELEAQYQARLAALLRDVREKYPTGVLRRVDREPRVGANIFESRSTFFYVVPAEQGQTAKCFDLTHQASNPPLSPTWVYTE